MVDLGTGSKHKDNGRVRDPRGNNNKSTQAWTARTPGHPWCETWDAAACDTFHQNRRCASVRAGVVCSARIPGTQMKGILRVGVNRGSWGEAG